MGTSDGAEWGRAKWEGRLGEERRARSEETCSSLLTRRSSLDRPSHVAPHRLSASYPSRFCGRQSFGGGATLTTYRPPSSVRTADFIPQFVHRASSGGNVGS